LASLDVPLFTALAAAEAIETCRGDCVKHGLAGRPYDQLLEMDQVNGQFPQTDVVLVVGANDVVNPAARDDPSSPIYGMPILDVDRARNIIVLKRSMGHGFAGIDNALFYHEKTRMLFGDARQSLTQVGQALKTA
jgi:NAD(P) transhydrogenase subunit beta